MKVVVAHNRYSSAQPSGENSMVDNEIAQLSAVGVTVVPFLRSSDEIANLSKSQKAKLAISPIYAADTQKQLAELLAAEKPDVLHLHNPYPFLSPAVVRTAQRHGVPVVQTVHNYRHVCVNGLYFRDGHLCHDCRGKALPTPGVLHACYRGSRAQSAVMATALVANRSTWRRVDRYIALTGAIAEHLRGYGITDDAISVKPNSIPDPGEHDVDGEGFAFVGRLSQEKGIALLLAAWRRHPDGSLGTLRVIGDGPQRDLVVAAAAERGDVEYLGGVPHEEVTACIRASGVVITSSLCDDVHPTVVIEALANARPVLTTDLGGPPHMIGEAGVVSAPDEAAFAEGLATIAGRARSLREVARARYLGHFSPEVVINRQLDIYRQVAAAASTG